MAAKSSAKTDTTAAEADMKKAMGQLDTLLEEYLVKKAPALPKGIKDFLVKFGPYFIILSLIMAVPALLAMLGLTASVSSSMYWAIAGYSGYRYYLTIAFTVIMVVLEALAVPGLLARSMRGWTLLYYSVLVNAVSLLVSGSLLTFLVSTGLSLYLLFQIRSAYH